MPRKAAADPAIAASPLDAVGGLGDAVLGELVGDQLAARDTYQHFVSAPDMPASVTARATLRLAQIEMLGGTRHVVELIKRAETLAPADPAVLDGVRRLQYDLFLITGADDLRGPRPGTTINVPAETAAAWARAEAQLEGVNRRELVLDFVRPLPSSIDLRVYPTRRLVNAYAAIAARGGVARVAARYRIASMYAALASAFANALMPPEFLPEKQNEWRGTLNAYEVEYLALAQQEYRDCIAAPQSEDSELWRIAAEIDLRILEVVATSPRLRGRR
ncbi:MAG: hypothetical protein KIT31_05140 [Deltaproteobacteria bacterium]|nr:hypothetical protein [Deltaproteobacteria bacterium]